MSVAIHFPHALLATLAKMKSAREHGVGMSVWDAEIKSVEDAIETIEAIRKIPANVRLINAAPDMLSALKYFISETVGKNPYIPTEITTRIVHAVRKAEG